MRETDLGDIIQAREKETEFGDRIEEDRIGRENAREGKGDIIGGQN